MLPYLYILPKHLRAPSLQTGILALSLHTEPLPQRVIKRSIAYILVRVSMAYEAQVVVHRVTDYDFVLKKGVDAGEKGFGEGGGGELMWVNPGD